MRYLIILVALSACVPVQTVRMPGGDVYEAKLNNGTLATIRSKDGTEVHFDRRGNPSIIEDVMKIYAIKTINGN